MDVSPKISDSGAGLSSTPTPPQPEDVTWSKLAVFKIPDVCILTFPPDSVNAKVILACAGAAMMRVAAAAADNALKKLIINFSEINLGVACLSWQG